MTNCDTAICVDSFPGSDPTGTTPSDTAVAAAIAQLGTDSGVIEFGVGTYRLDGSAVLAHPGQYFKFPGLGVTSIDFRGTGPALKVWDSTVSTGGTTAPGRGGGVLGGVTILGVNNTNDDAIGLQLGDLVAPVVEDVRISGFTTEGCIGFLGQNRYSWCEYGRLRIQGDNNTTNFVLEAHPDHPLPYGTTSWSYNMLDWGFSAEADQNGVIVRNHVAAVGCTWAMKFNCNPGATNSGVAFTFGSDGDDYVHIEAGMDWSGETTNAGAVGHVDMNWHGGGNLRGVGSLIFNDFSAPFVAGNIAPDSYKVVFAGRVDSPSFGHYARNEIGFVTIGDPGRFGVRGDSANYVRTEENPWGDPVIRAKGPGVPGSGHGTSVGIAMVSQFDPGDTRRSLITIDGVNVVATLDSMVTHTLPGKSTPVDADELAIADSAASWTLKKLTWANVKAALATLFVGRHTGNDLSQEWTVSAGASSVNLTNRAIPAGAVGVRVTMIPGGFGGGSGRRGAAGTVRCGGGGGGAFGVIRDFFIPVGSNTTWGLAVSAPCLGGAAVTTDNTDGNDASSPGFTYFQMGSQRYSAMSSTVTLPGKGGTATSGAGGNWAAAPTAPASASGASASTSGGAGGNGTGVGWIDICGGAGAGGGITAANVAANGGSGGEARMSQPGTSPAGGVVDSTLPAAGSGAVPGLTGPGAGGGAASITTAAQAGADGISYGAPGGGGGASLNGNNSGRGGNGGPAYARIDWVYG
ncbi:hypothetical protein FHT40_004145 [Mycolicibacterium sp. BK556]|uniref:hypothetical protein n=1 Tax=unclassified Mycolicibacterium TaxID=2636767 RepID=UPI00160E27DD|nr:MULTISPECIES: hypothetical protein [unclassified Mycolicibacterium]MBB3604467.1 hypothetical protein [Mycolicibacterium sp. BK556]MBB3634820.1 hypothetical protein [Mycolicibacterium sp. BK607]